ncbi:MAG: hypothetical protein CL610_30190 [Anaerolineaceae bacterium]|nr:hypothetical protein [Anaerolineaceae bacterium]
MISIETAIVLWIGAFFSAIIGSIIPAMASARQAKEEREAEKQRDEIQVRGVQRRERLDYYLEHLRQIRKARAELQYLQIIFPDADDPRFKQQQTVYGDAYSILLSIPEPGFHDFADNIMNKEGSEKLEAIDDAIKKLGERIHEIVQSE